MTTTTPDTVALPAAGTGRTSVRLRFAVAFLAGLIATLGLGAGALYAFDQQYTGRVLPGVRVGNVDLSGLGPAAAGDALRDAYTTLGAGTLTIETPAGQRAIAYADIGRGPDVEAMVEEALAVGRTGGPLDRAIADARTALRGVALTPARHVRPRRAGRAGRGVRRRARA